MPPPADPDPDLIAAALDEIITLYGTGADLPPALRRRVDRLADRVECGRPGDTGAIRVAHGMVYPGPETIACLIALRLARTGSRRQTDR